PHSGSFTALGAVSALPHGVNERDIRRVISSQSFKAMAQQLIAARIANSHASTVRLQEAIYELFVEMLCYGSIPEQAQGPTRDFRAYYTKLWASLIAACDNVVEQLTSYPVTSGHAFSWANATLSLATAESIDRRLDHIREEGQTLADPESDWVER